MLAKKSRYEWDWTNQLLHHSKRKRLIFWVPFLNNDVMIGFSFWKMNRGKNGARNAYPDHRCSQICRHQQNDNFVSWKQTKVFYQTRKKDTKLKLAFYVNLEPGWTGFFASVGHFKQTIKEALRKLRNNLRPIFSIHLFRYLHKKSFFSVVFLSKITFTKFHYKNLSIRQLNFSLFSFYGLALDNFIEAHFLAANGSVKDSNYFSGTGRMKSTLTFKNF